jgi:hypothetical protein
MINFKRTAKGLRLSVGFDAEANPRVRFAFNVMFWLAIVGLIFTWVKHV